MLDELVLSRCEKLRRLRKMARLSRQAFSKKYHIPAATLQSWETPRLGGPSESGGRQMIQYYAELGIKVDYAWLMYDSGDGPDFWRNVKSGKFSSVRPVVRKVEKEVGACVAARKKCVVYRLTSDVMLPRYRQGDVFIGSPLHSRQSESSLQGCLCIVYFDANQHELGYVADIKPRKKSICLFRSSGSEDSVAIKQGHYESVWPITTIVYADRQSD